MSPVMWLVLGVGISLILAMLFDRAWRAREQAQASARRQWFEYAEIAARNAEQWRTR